MVNALKLILAAGAVVAALSMPASAADMDLPIFVEQAPDEVPVEIGSGWYIRGDVGYELQTSSKGFSYNTFDPVTLTYSPQTFVTADVEGDVTYSVGVGYHYNDWMRFDATLDGFKSEFTGSTAAATNCPGQLPGTSCRTNDTQPLSTYQLMANAYVDLGTYVGLTPYVGAGAGVAYVDYGTLTNQFICVPGAVTCGTLVTSTARHEGADSLRFAYSLMAGVGYQASKNVKLDLGYRYSHIAGGDQFYYDPATIAAGATGIQGTDDGYDRHEVRMGVRYSLW
jgi:opacity protein-like surface antigen